MMQAKDIDDKEILSYIANRQKELGHWICVWDLEEPYSTMPDRLFRAKTGKLIKRGLLSGCSCGCRGDYTITDKGIDYLAE